MHSSSLFERTEQTQTHARRLQQLHENVQSGFWKRGEAASLWCVTQISSSVPEQTSPCFYEFIKAAVGCVFKCTLQKTLWSICVERNEVISIPLCVSLSSSSSSLWSALALSLSQFQFIIRKPDEFSPPLRLSSLLHSAENCFNLHLFAANPLLSVYLSVYCTHSPSAGSNKNKL